MVGIDGGVELGWLGMGRAEEGQQEKEPSTHAMTIYSWGLEDGGTDKLTGTERHYQYRERPA